MTMNNPLGDMLTRIRNGQHAGKPVVRCMASRLKTSVLDVLKTEGFIRAWRQESNDRGHPELLVELKYDHGQPAIHGLRQISVPGQRYYRGAKALPRSRNGLGVYIVSTPKGVMTDHEARAQNIGGEVLGEVF